MGFALDGAGGGDAPRLLRHNVTLSGAVLEEAYDYYQVCVARHEHAHRVTLRLHVADGSDADLYVSASIRKPTFAHCTWISADAGDDEISLPTHHPDWPTDSNTLFVGVRGRDPGRAARYTLGVTLEPWVPRSHAPPGGQQRLRGRHG